MYRKKKENLGGNIRKWQIASSLVMQWMNTYKNGRSCSSLDLFNLVRRTLILRKHPAFDLRSTIDIVSYVCLNRDAIPETLECLFGYSNQI